MFGENGVKDVVNYGGLFSGIIATHFALVSMGVTTSIIRIGAGFLVGAGVGYVAQKVYEGAQKKD